MRLQPALFTLLLLSPMPLQAETETVPTDQWLLCPPVDSQQNKYSPPQSFAAERRDETRISAKLVENAAGDVSIFSGDVLIERDQLRLQTDKAIYSKTEEILELEGNVHIDTANMGINASLGHMNLKLSTGEFTDTSYFIPSSHFSGSAPSLSVTGKQQTRLVDSSFTSCPLDRQDWHLDTSLLELDQQTATGTAKHAVLWFKQVPIFYFPYVSFPLGEQRRSGFLMPSFGTSSARGFELAIPWYWNIAPNQDAILAPHYMRKRGVLLDTNYRYLTASSNGELDVEYLNNDEELQQERYLIKYQQHSKLARNTSLDIDVNDASDSNYLNDMGSDINISNITHLQRTAKLGHAGSSWNMSMMAQSYETIDELIAESDRPYRRLPQIKLDGSDELIEDTLGWSLSSEWVDFQHESAVKSEGQRFYLYPKISLPLQGDAWFLKPAIGLHHSQYSVTDGSGAELDIVDRNISISSVDAGLFFERFSADSKYLQTLEPRIYYLNIPYEDQSNIPVFDTGEVSFSYAQMFRENRFNGVDRIGDTEQVTVGISSRYINIASGKELMSISLGQIYYFEDRLVSIDNSSIAETQNQSEVIAEFTGNIDDWSTRASLLWDPETDTMDKRNIQLNYNSDSNYIFNIAYRFQRDPNDQTNNLEQSDISFSWPLTASYALMGRWNYSLTEERDIQTLFGIEYNSCCWAMRVVAQRYLTDDSIEPYDSSVMFQLILKGLGSVHGKKASDSLKRAILGYQSEY